MSFEIVDSIEAMTSRLQIRDGQQFEAPAMSSENAGSIETETERLKSRDDQQFEAPAISSENAGSIETKTVRLKSRDGQQFEVKVAVASMSKVIWHVIDDDCANDVVPLPNVDAKTLSKVLEYCEKHAEEPKIMSDEELKNWDADYINVDQQELLQILMAANYMAIQELLELGVEETARRIRGQMPEAIRTSFNIINDFTPEEEMQIRNENAWAFEM